MPDIDVTSALGEEGIKNLFNNIMGLWIRPHLEELQKQGKLSQPFNLQKAQIILRAGEKPIVRINSEVKAVAKVRVNRNIRRGELVTENDISEIVDVDLSPEEDPDVAHVTMVRFRNHWLIHFDFRYNRRVREYAVAAYEFLESSKKSLADGLLRPFVDNLYSATELIVEAFIFLTLHPKNMSRHKRVQMLHGQLVKNGKQKVEYNSNLNKLTGLRNVARYLKQRFELSEKDAAEYLRMTQEMYDKLVLDLDHP